MSLYATQKFLYAPEPRRRRCSARYRGGDACDAARRTTSSATRSARRSDAGDIGKLYVLGCNGQLLMHFAPLLGMPWADYLEAMREGVRKYGPVRAGIYAMTTGTDEKVAGV